MRPVPRPVDETERGAVVDDLLLESDPDMESAFERVSRMVTTQLHVPMSAFSVLYRGRQCFRWSHGLDVDWNSGKTSFCTHAIQQDDVFVVPDARRHKDFHDDPLVIGGPRVAFYAGASVRTVNRRKIGVLTALDNRPRRFTTGMRQALLDLRDILEALIELRTLSVLDHLTRLYNRRHFDAVIDREWHRACRLSLPVALLTIDIDYFKRFNDSYGHQAGDECLRKVAETLKTECKRSGDIPFRTGGEEFAVLLTVTDGKQGAVEFADRLRQAIRDLAIPHKHSPSGIVTITIGLASANSFPTDGSGFERFVRCSDEALYAAKHQGRDRVLAKSFGVNTGCIPAEFDSPPVSSGAR